MMGSGKSTVAKLLAARLGWAAVDTDRLVETKAERSVAEIFAEDGEAVFRQAEAAAIAELAQRPGPLVVSVGGGAVTGEQNRAAMRAVGTVVWLRARPATLAERVGAGHGRPLLARGGRGSTPAGAREVLERLDHERRALYQGVADLVVDVDGLSPHQVARQVAGLLRDPVGPPPDH
jgi:shikimate kinase